MAFESSSLTLVCRQLYDFVVTVQQPWELHHVKVLDATVDCRWPFDPTKDCELWKCCRPSHETCVPECTPVSRPETWSSTVTSRQHVCWNVMWTDGRNGTPVYWYVGRWKERYTCILVCGQMEGTVHLCFWLDFATMGMRLLSACAAYRGICCQ